MENIAYEAARQGTLPGATEAKITEKVTPLLKAIGAIDAKVEITPEKITSETQDITVSIVVDLEKNSWVMKSFVQGKMLSKSVTLTRERTKIAGASDLGYLTDVNAKMSFAKVAEGL